MTGKKKRSSAPQPPPSSSEPEPTSSSSSSSSPLSNECNRVFGILHNGTYSEALEAAKSLVTRHPDSALANALIALVHKDIAISISDTSSVVIRREHIVSALYFSNAALVLSPDSISFPMLRAVVLLTNEQYDSAIQECESALSIKNPLDPMQDNLGIVQYTPIDSTLESRVGKVRTKLRELIAKAKKYKFKKLVEDNSLAFRALQAIKVEINTRLENVWQRLVELPSPSTSRKLLKKVLLNVDAITRARAYWNNEMSLEAKKELLSVSVDVNFDMNKSMGVKAKEVLAEAVEYAKETKNWKFSTCCCCGERFFDEELNMEHIKIDHLGTLSEELQSVVPRILLKSEIEICDWKPVDVEAAVKLIEDSSRNESGDQGQDKGKSQDLTLENWPYCNDTNREDMIKRIWTILQVLIGVKCFAPSHLYMLLDLILEMLKNRIPETLLKQHWMNRTLVSVLFLDEPELKSVREFIEEELEISCGLGDVYSSFTMDNAIDDLTISHERIIFSNDLSHLILLLDETSAKASRSVDESRNACQEYRDDIVQWLYMGSEPIGEKLEEWANYRKASKNLGMDLFKIIESEFRRLQKICERKYKYLREEKLWLDMEGICLEEDKRREEISGNPQSYKSLLLKRQKEIQMEECNDETGSMELDIIGSILKKAQADNDINMLIQMHIDQLFGKCFKSDALILGANASIQLTWKKLKMAQLEEMVDEDATKKSNAALEDLLSGLNLDAKKNTEKGGDDARHGQGKSKNKKKKKDHRKVKEFKATGGSEDQQENVEQNLVPAAHGTDHPLNSEVVGSVTTDELEQEEREITCTAEEESRIEEHQRMLARHLEYQRQIENEAKQKRLAEIDEA
uniref:C2H2-type domain-containing protein n=1 Tax=Quercus lobata TaxID=97700 RepID=A0A7N2LMK6_QUELO